jgi:hypothetical protein
MVERSVKRGPKINFEVIRNMGRNIYISLWMLIPHHCQRGRVKATGISTFCQIHLFS